MYVKLFHGCEGREVQGDVIMEVDSKEAALKEARERALDDYAYFFNGPSYADCAQALLSEKGIDFFKLCEKYGVSFNDIEKRFSEEAETYLRYYFMELTEEEYFKNIQRKRGV